MCVQKQKWTSIDWSDKEVGIKGCKAEKVKSIELSGRLKEWGTVGVGRIYKTIDWS